RRKVEYFRDHGEWARHHRGVGRQGDREATQRDVRRGADRAPARPGDDQVPQSAGQAALSANNLQFSCLAPPPGGKDFRAARGGMMNVAGAASVRRLRDYTKPCCITCLICSAFLPASPRRSSVRAFAAKSLPAMIRAIAMTASMDGVGTSTALPIALIGIRPAGTSSDTYLCSKDLGVPVAWYGPSELHVSFRQVSGNVFSRTP